MPTSLPLSAPGLGLDAADLVLGQTRLPLAKVRSLSLAQWTYPRRNSLFGMVEVRVFEITIHVSGQAPLIHTLDEEQIPPGVVFKKEDFDRFDSLYGQVLDATFRYRIQSYLDDLDNKGFFRLGSVDFYPGKKVGFRNRSVPADQVTVRHIDRNLWVRNKIPSLFNHFNVRIPLDQDPDVYLELVRRFEAAPRI